MKKRRNLISVIRIMMLLLTLSAVAIISPSCAARRKAAKTEVAPPPPPPPPPASEEEIPFVVVEEMPMFPGGDSALLAFIAKNTVYPEEAKKNGIQGRVIVRFAITSRGTVEQVKVLKGVSPELDNEAIRVMGLLPEFKPGRQGGKPVAVWYMVPITFSLGPKDKQQSDTIPGKEPYISKPQGDDEPYTEVEEMPFYPGGDGAFLNYIVKNVVYPPEAKKQGIQGKVIARFCVTKDGSVDRVSVMRGVSPELDKEAMRVVGSLSGFRPGRQGGKPVDVWYTVPIEFALK
ncbi:MAG: energy transducer TonB [Methanosarcina sp.]